MLSDICPDRLAQKSHVCGAMLLFIVTYFFRHSGSAVVLALS